MYGVEIKATPSQARIVTQKKKKSIRQEPLEREEEATQRVVHGVLRLQRRSPLVRLHRNWACGVEEALR